MIKQDMELLVQGQLDAYNRRELQKFCTYFHPEIVAVDLVGGNTVCEGMERFAAYYEQRFSTSPKLHCDLRKRIVFDTSVIDEEYI